MTVMPNQYDSVSPQHQVYSFPQSEKLPVSAFVSQQICQAPRMVRGVTHSTSAEYTNPTDLHCFAKLIQRGMIRISKHSLKLLL